MYPVTPNDVACKFMLSLVWNTSSKNGVKRTLRPKPDSLRSPCVLHLCFGIPHTSIQQLMNLVRLHFLEHCIYRNVKVIRSHWSIAKAPTPGSITLSPHHLLLLSFSETTQVVGLDVIVPRGILLEVYFSDLYCILSHSHQSVRIIRFQPDHFSGNCLWLGLAVSGSQVLHMLNVRCMLLAAYWL